MDVTSSPGVPGPIGPDINAMGAALARNWWAVALRAVFAIVFGIIALFSPQTTIQALIFLFAIYMFADGIAAITAAVRAVARHASWGLLALEGVVDIVAGVLVLALPGLTVLVFTTLLGIWAVVSGALLLFAAVRWPMQHGRWLLALSGIVSIVWGVLLYLSPITGAVVLTWWLGGYALVFGFILLFVALRLRGQHGSVTTGYRSM